MKNDKLTICDTYVHPGEVANLALPFPERYSCSPLYMPMRVFHGKEKGPCLVIFSTLKGNELNGLEIVNRTIQEIDPSKIKGTVIAVPAINVYGLTHFPSQLPTGGNLEDCFPGSPDGSFGERIAYLFTEEILKKADYCIELQTGSLNHNILPQVYCNFDNVRTKQLAKSFQSPVVTNVTHKQHKLRQTTEALQIPLLVYQAGEAMRFDENAITLGVNGILNVMRAVDILPKAPVQEIQPIFSQDEDWILSHFGGVFHTDVTLGQTIKEGEVIGRITDPFGVDFLEKVRAPQEGIVVGINTTPLIHEGLPIFKIASFLDYEKAGNIIEEWESSKPESP
ncbi:MAG: N-alpha-acetyl-L-2,4-diaminobutyric acid deacetylase [Chlamydiia bacterium]|nr:N-alpha-acetyl-L-2,4-diaminobutyric acid deacetylase [Chlamydiia bacterium]